MLNFSRYLVSRARVTAALAITCIVVFGLEAIGSTSYNALLGTGRRLSPVLAFGVVFRPAIDAGEWWRLITAGFLHFGAIHLLLNLYALVYVGVALEPRFGSKRFAGIYLAALVGGNVAAYQFQSPQSFSAGASGAIMGMFGAMALIGLRYLSGRQQRIWLQSAVFPIVATLAFGFSQPNISNAAHIGGLLCGFVAASLLGVSPDWKRLLAAQQRATGAP